VSWLSQRQVSNLVALDRDSAQVTGREDEVVFVLERETVYRFRTSLPVAINGYSVLSTGKNGFSRWQAISGRYARSYAKHKIPVDEYAEIFPYERLSIKNQPLTIDAGGRLVLREEACFYGGK